MLADIALQCGGVNFFALYDLSTSGTSQSIGLWFGDSNSCTAFSSTLSISNELGAADGTAIFYPSVDTVLRRDPNRIAAGVYLPYQNGSIYTYDYDTSYEFAFGDQVAPTATITSQAQATALADQFLATFDEQDERISTRIWVPPANLYDVRAGHRMQATFTHLPGYETPQWMRVTQKSISNFDTSMERYQIPIKLAHGRLEAFLFVQNLFNTKSEHALFAFESRLRSEATGVTDIHFVPGNPRMVMGGVAWYF